MERPRSPLHVEVQNHQQVWEKEKCDHRQHIGRTGSLQWDPFKGKLGAKSIEDFRSEMSPGHEEGAGEDLRQSGSTYACQNLHHTQLPRPIWDGPLLCLALDMGECAESSLALGWRGLLAGPFQTHHLSKPQPGWLCSAIMCLKSNKTKCFSVSPLRDHV